MIITDRIHGRVDVTDPLIIDLINSAPMQRLKQISQDGATHFIQPVFNGNRFEHSFGAWYLAKHFDRPIEEQVACLLHDIPHTAFSHVIDFVVDDPNQEYHDRFLKQIVFSSEIPQICESHGLDIHKVLRKEDYYLLDNNTPELSFDRWDYFMRDAHMMGILSHETIQLIATSAKIRDGQFYFTDLNIASQLCIASLMVAQLGYVSATSHGAWFLLASALKIALGAGIITEQDFFTTDKEVLDKLHASNNKEITDYLVRLRPGREFVYAPKGEAEFYGRNKARYVDPLVLHGSKLENTSKLVVGLERYVDEFRERCKYVGVRQQD